MGRCLRFKELVMVMTKKMMMVMIITAKLMMMLKANGDVDNDKLIMTEI